jgi:lipopolysaccharide/colanic/teichoic acid biosynthesis glycosyltransferase
MYEDFRKLNIYIKIDKPIMNNNLFWFTKRLFDLLVSISLLPVLAFMSLLILFLNIFFNEGNLFYIQKRMGKNCEPFYAIKFRTMRGVNIIKRKFSDPIEEERITILGRVLRKIRLDELPQIINVIKGDMSLIGPRPDYYEHAIIYLDIIPNYASRYVIKPGISGLSQIRLGYAEGIDATKRKSNIDIYYINNLSFYLDAKIFFATILTIIKGYGK